jgi:hypothetical protein
MARVLILALLVVVALDFSTPDAVLSVAAARSAHGDDEEDSVPARRQLVTGAEQRTPAFPVTPRPLEPARTLVSAERRAAVDRLHDRPAAPVPFRRVPTPSIRSASAPDDH